MHSRKNDIVSRPNNGTSTKKTNGKKKKQQQQSMSNNTNLYKADEIQKKKSMRTLNKLNANEFTSTNARIPRTNF